ncbi:MAG TPA: GNAT family N-acyltransferase [Candidatus Angelobacter sp.]
MRIRKAQRVSGNSFTLGRRRQTVGARAHVVPAQPVAPLILPIPTVTRPLRAEPYYVSLAQTDSERRAAFRLRFRVFNLEMNEGLESSYQTGEDTDAFDAVCDHLIVRHRATDEIVGTYRLQTGETAARNLGYYSAREFEFASYEPLRSQVVELGRACIHPHHRKYEVLILLWKGIARYGRERNARYLIGCSSISTQDQLVGSAVYEKLKPMLAPEELRTVPQTGCGFPIASNGADVGPPKLLRAYLSVGARICGPPALDREFRTIDFLTLMDLNSLSPSVRSRFIES